MPGDGTTTGGIASDDDGRTIGGRDLPVAIVVGIALAVVFVGTLFWTAEAFVAVVTVVTVLAVVEVARVLPAAGMPVLRGPLVLATLVGLGGAYLAGPRGQVLGPLSLLFAAVVVLLADGSRREVMRSLATTLLLGLWLPFLASYAVLLVSRSDGRVAVLGVIGAAILTDVGGYGFGVAFGRHRVAPSVSPNKTWEGLLGGVVTAGLLGALVLPALGDTFTAVTGAVLAVVCGCASFVGDLTESMLKRDIGVKDLGAYLPGHGGVLDRVDGILFALPVGYHLLDALA